MVYWNNSKGDESQRHFVLLIKSIKFQSCSAKILKSQVLGWDLSTKHEMFREKILIKFLDINKILQDELYVYVKTVIHHCYLQKWIYYQITTTD